MLPLSLAAASGAMLLLVGADLIPRGASVGGPAARCDRRAGGRPGNGEPPRWGWGGLTGERSVVGTDRKGCQPRMGVGVAGGIVVLRMTLDHYTRRCVCS